MIHVIAALGVIVLVFFSMNFYAQSRGVIGKWNTIDEVSGKALSVVEIFESNNRIYGKVVEILNPKNRKDKKQTLFMKLSTKSVF